MSTAVKEKKGLSCFVPSVGLKIVRNTNFVALAVSAWKGGKWSEGRTRPAAQNAWDAAM